MNMRREVAVATAVVGYNLTGGHEQEKVRYNRFLVSAVLVGSAAAGDTQVDIRVGGKTVEQITNVATGLAVLNTYPKAMRVFVPANTLVENIVSDAPGTNPVVIDLEFIP